MLWPQTALTPLNSCYYPPPPHPSTRLTQSSVREWEGGGLLAFSAPCVYVLNDYDPFNELLAWPFLAALYPHNKNQYNIIIANDISHTFKFNKNNIRLLDNPTSHSKDNDCLVEIVPMFGKFISVSGTYKLLKSQYRYCYSIICRLHVRNYNVVDFPNFDNTIFTN